MTYFDHAASNPVDPRVAAAMADVASFDGNPSSLHAAGRELRGRIDAARRSVAELFSCDPSEIVFTSGATESNAMAVACLLRAGTKAGTRPHVLASPVEHPSVMAALERVAARGEADVEYLPVDRSGRVSVDDVRSRLRPETALVCVMWANNVLGTLQPVAEIGAVVAGSGAVFFSDAVQAVSTQPVFPAQAGVDAMSFSGHKMYGPKGVGGLYLRCGLAVEPLIAGGDQESGRRSGTENVSGIVGLGIAADILRKERERDAAHAAVIRETLLSALPAARCPLHALGPDKDCVPGILYLQPSKEDGETLAMKLDIAGFAVSTGSACAAGARKPSHVLSAVFDENTARRGGIRISFGRLTSQAEAAALSAALSAAPAGRAAVPATEGRAEGQAGS